MAASAPPAYMMTSGTAAASAPPAAYPPYMDGPPAAGTAAAASAPPAVATGAATTPARLPGGLGRRPMSVQCPYCSLQGVTRTRNQFDALTIVSVIVLVFFFWPLAWLPLVMPCCQTTEHYCQRCHRKVRIHQGEFNMSPQISAGLDFCVWRLMRIIHLQLARCCDEFIAANVLPVTDFKDGAL